MDFATRRRLFNRCNPAKALSPLDPMNVDLDSMGDRDLLPRGVCWVDRLATKVEISDDPAFLLFTGLPGAGKTTELMRLARRLEERNRGNLLVVQIDAGETLDLSARLDVPDLMAVLVEQTERAVLKEEGLNPDDALKDGYLKRLSNWLQNTDIEFKKAEFKIDADVALTAELRTRPVLRERFRQTIAIHLSRFIKEAHDELILLEGRAKKRGRAGLMLIVDSLEKLRGMSTNYEQVLTSAEQLFTGGASYLKLPVNVLYTVPAALVCRRHFPEVCFMPMIRLRNRNDGSRFETGFQAARELVRKRVADRDLALKLGSDWEKRIERLIDFSGGYPRELVRLLQAVFAVEGTPIPDAAFERIINEVRDSYRRLVNAGDYEWLAEVALKKDLVLADDGRRQLAERMLSDNAVLRYLNSSDWFDLHPAVQDIPGVKEALGDRGPGSA